MDPQTMAILQALSGSQAPTAGALSPFGGQAAAPGSAPGTAPAGPAGGAYSLPQDPTIMQPPGTGQNASLGNGGAGTSLSLAGGQADPNTMYGAMMTPPPTPNYWGAAGGQ
jgi:hypothetical protein